ncbi:MAG: ATP-binding protein [Methanoregulaceae archaeon]|nr:ATP-binding protein [Methanoregulaceae archaeon]
MNSQKKGQEKAADAGETRPHDPDQLLIPYAVFREIVQRMFVYDANGVLTDIDTATESITGREIVSMHMDEVARKLHFRTPGGSPIPSLQLPPRRALEGTPVRDMPLVIADKDGNDRTILLSAHPLQKEGEVIGALVTWEDDHQGLSETGPSSVLQKDQEILMLQEVVDQMPVGVILAEAPSGRLAFTNQRIREIWRAPLPPTGSLPEDWGMNGFHLDWRPYEIGEWPLSRSLATGEVVRNDEIEILRGDKTKGAVSVSSAPVRDRNGVMRYGVVTFTDITERKLAEEELTRLNAALARSNQELEQFAYVASHDLREPLRMVASFSQLLSQRYSGKMDADADEFINYIIDGATRMDLLVNDLLEYSRVTSQGKPFAPINLNLVVSDVSRNLAVAIEESGADVRWGVLPEVVADRSQMFQLFQNLISNAIKFRGPETPSIRIKTQNLGNEWLICVSDNGIGIDPGYHAKIFEIFQRLHSREKYPGTGIGLAICRKIIEHHGGRIWVESGEGKGSTFSFTIPIRDEQEATS